MSLIKTLGGDRLGSGKKMKVEMHNYERANFDLSRIWRSTTTPGVLLPFFTEIGLNGDTFDINLSAMARTVPTQGALFGSFKLQMDVFATPIRLYNGLLHNNALNIGMNMSQVKMPTIKLWQTCITETENDRVKLKEIKKWSNTCLSSMFCIRGVSMNGARSLNNQWYSEYDFNALAHLTYYDIYKSYYANKQEEKGQLISGKYEAPLYIGISTVLEKWNETLQTTQWETIFEESPLIEFNEDDKEIKKQEAYIVIKLNDKQLNEFNNKKVKDDIVKLNPTGENVNIVDHFTWGYVNQDIKNNPTNLAYHAWNRIVNDLKLNDDEQKYYILLPIGIHVNKTNKIASITIDATNNEMLDQTQWLLNGFDIDIKEFPLENIDEMRREILRTTDFNQAIEINKSTYLPYGANAQAIEGTQNTANEVEFNGVCLKTYQSDIFNNWLSSEWVENINNLSTVSTVNGGFSMDALNLAKKIYEMLNRIAVSGGTYEDWQEAVYGQEAIRRAESPIYCGGASAEIVFDEVISNSATEDEPLGTIAGRGNLQGFKNGQIVIKCDEPMFIMGIVSITPRIDYSQNRAWWARTIKTMDDFHKPGLDGIGFQDLMADQMCWESTELNKGEIRELSIGKQPAWINYQTAINELHGEFCDKDKLGWMVLDRSYQKDEETDEWDFTTYIDPRKYNYPFAYKELDAQNFWLQIGTNIQARRKMSAKVMPNV